MDNLIMLGASSMPSVDAVSHGIHRLGLDLGDALVPCMLQRDGNWFAELLPVIIFMAATILPSLAQARKKAREKQAGGKRPAPPVGRSVENTPSSDPGVQPALRGSHQSQDSAYPDSGVQPALRGRTSSPDSSSPNRGTMAGHVGHASQSTSQSTSQATSQAAPKAGASDLEARVRRYFEELAGPATPTRTPPPPPIPQPARGQTPARPKPPAAPPTQGTAEKHGELVDIHVELSGVSNRTRLPSRQRPSKGFVPQRAQAQSGAQKGRTRVVHPLLRRTSIRDAVILREVLGPPKGLDGL